MTKKVGYRRGEDSTPTPEEMEERVAAARRKAYAKRDMDVMLSMVQGGHVPIETHIIDTLIDWVCKGDDYLEKGKEKELFWFEVAEKYRR